MEALKKSRTIQRRLFTRSLNGYNDICKKTTSTYQEKKIAMHLLEERMAELVGVSNKFVSLLFDSDSSEEEIELEIESHNDYQLQFLKVKVAFDDLTANQISTNSTQIRENSTVATRSEKPFKKPTLQIPMFSGNVGDWLQFWSHFRKVHDDVSVSKEDKLEYLKQSVEKGSKADNVVSGYPTSAENYSKALESLKLTPHVNLTLVRHDMSDPLYCASYGRGIEGKSRIHSYVVSNSGSQDVTCGL